MTTEEENSNKEKLRAQAEKLKAEAAHKVEIEKNNKELALSQLAQVEGNNELRKMFEESSQVGAENLAGELPLLKIHLLGRSKNRLSDGTEPKNGWFFYKPTGEQFETVTCHILTISAGFRAEDLQGKEKFHQIMAGAIQDEGGLKPFLMYMTGKKLSPMWDFGKEANKYTHKKPVPIPMFAMSVKISAHLESNDFGDSWVPEFEILKNDDGSPVVVTDPEEFQYLKRNVEKVKETIKSLIEAKAGEGSGEADGNPSGPLPFN